MTDPRFKFHGYRYVHVYILFKKKIQNPTCYMYEKVNPRIIIHQHAYYNPNIYEYTTHTSVNSKVNIQLTALTRTVVE